MNRYGYYGRSYTGYGYGYGYGYGADYYGEDDQNNGSQNRHRVWWKKLLRR
jgi:hypothetical protein